MIYGSVCSGIEAATVAWGPLGWTPAFFSEIEPFPCAVLAHHYQSAPNLGDMTKFKEWPEYAIDVLVGGTPCQDLSVAGKRAGLAGERSGLFRTFVAVAERYKPRWIVWENVPGALSTNGGKDIQEVIDSLTQIGYACDVEILDAQFFGLAQRRRRIFIVCVRLGDLLKQRTPLSERVAGELLLQPLLDTWAAILQAWCPGRSLSGYASPIEQSANSAKRRIELLEKALDGSACTKLLAALGAAPRPATGEQRSSVSTSAQYCDRPNDGSNPAIGGFPSWSTGDVSGSKSTDTSWNSILAALSDRKSACITSTSIPATTASEICSFAGQSLRIARSITGSKNCSDQPKWSSDYWNLTSLLLITMEAVTEYARQAIGDLFSEASLRDDWRHHLDEARSIACQSHRNLGNEPSSGTLFSIPEGLRGHTPPRRQAGQRPSPTISARPTGGGGLGTDFDCDGGLIVHSLRAEGFDASEDGTGRGAPLVPVTTLAIRGRGDTHQLECRQDGTANAILTPNGGRAGIGVGAIHYDFSVRRLTPRECARLQGFQDDYIDIEYRGKPAADGPKYKALGNSFAVPVVRWIGERIQIVEDLPARQIGDIA